VGICCTFSLPTTRLASPSPGQLQPSAGPSLSGAVRICARLALPVTGICHGHRVFMSPASQPPCPPSGLCRGGRQGVGFPPRPPGLLHRRLQLAGSGAQRCRRWGWGGGTRICSNRQGRGVVMSALMERQWYAISEHGTAAK
jgi:hypothetical protein